ncbi:MAG: site-specific DNA-methyltransferase [Proteobacteria bacterium]|nr:site-specific DNA-methyltransferase [Pseudomonadota bacterium]MBU1687388.1 site-specific DNA-methyltransferase [Pseudomonadota bacterium]
MPELIWKGKEQVVNHHLEVPVKTLDRQYTFNGAGEAESDNKIIHGDNLEALKALLPQYEGRVNCIYIDPPYNTGNESWVYNDNVKDPRIVKWLGEVVGKEGEDLCRHDKWLCMMYPRLQLLKRLLADDGTIWISIDDNEVANLRLVMDEIFGQRNFIANVIWQKVFSPKNTAKHFSEDHDFIMIYARNAETWRPNPMPRTTSQDGAYKNPDNDPRGPWTSGDLSARNFYGEGTYSITCPSGRIIENPPSGRYWAISKQKFEELDRNNRIWWGKNRGNMPRLKRFLTDVKQGVVPQTLWSYKDAGHTQDAKKELLAVLDFETSADVFVSPKPTKLIDRILHIATDKNSLILDSFAGSGTTAQAVLNLNKKDNGNRKFILIEMMDYAETITAERIKRVIKGYGEDTKEVVATGGDFTYFTLGERVFNEDGNLNEAIGPTKIREYVAWSEKLPEAQNDNNPYWLGEKDRTGYYFYYESDTVTVLNLDFLATLSHQTEAYLVYADTCLLDAEFMHRKHIRFKKIPRDISRF